MGKHKMKDEFHECFQSFTKLSKSQSICVLNKEESPPSTVTQNKAILASVISLLT
jgi:hypothetical protein